MALFKIQIFKTQTGERFWTNVYHVDAVDINAASSFATTVLASGETVNMSNAFRVVKSLVSDPATDEFVTVPLNLPGQISGSEWLPLFNTVKVNVSVAGNGRNDYKFYRGSLLENQTANGQIDAGTIASFNDVIDSFIADGTAAGVDMVDNEGNLWLVAATQTAVQMRQLHRRRRPLGEPS